jgi:hypothetical protein
MPWWARKYNSNITRTAIPSFLNAWTGGPSHSLLRLHDALQHLDDRAGGTPVATQAPGFRREWLLFGSWTAMCLLDTLEKILILFLLDAIAFL